MGRAEWTPAMDETILQHLETEKGDQGLYVTDRRAAINKILELLTESFTSNPVQAKQVEDRISNLFYRFRDNKHSNINSLFSLGRIVLKPPYNRRLSASINGDNDEWTPSDHHSSSDETTAKRSPKCPARKRTPFKTPSSSSRKKSK